MTKSIASYRHLYSFPLGKRIQVILGFQFPGTGFQSFPVVLRFWIPIVIGIPDLLSLIPDSRTKNLQKKSNNLHTRVRRRASQSSGNNCQDCETLLQAAHRQLIISYPDLTLPLCQLRYLETQHANCKWFSYVLAPQILFFVSISRVHNSTIKTEVKIN